MKKAVLFILPALFLWAPLQINSQEWIPAELANMESGLLELQSQVSTLDSYSPEKFPDFKDLEKINQLVEQLEFSRRKFDLLIMQYNLVEDEIFAFLLKFSTANPRLRDKIILKVREYAGEEPKSILLIQKEINRLALQIERLEKKIERVREAAKKREIEEEKKKTSAREKEFTLSARIRKLEEEKRGFKKEIEEETRKLKQLRQEEQERKNKIEEKRSEITRLKERSQQTTNDVERLINQTFARVRESRINGLEIPRLNTAKTFIYLKETAIDTLKGKEKNTASELASLNERRKGELQNRLIKGFFIIFIALFVVFTLNKISSKISKKILARLERSERLDAHRKQRYQTLSSVILSFIRILLWALAVLWVLGELNIDYAPFLVAAGGISLAIGFGAQSLVKDIVSGFFILMEEQFALGDVVEIEGKTGTIEKISLRTVKFRSLDGTLHIIPNGSISRVSNLTHLWSRAIINVGVSYDEDADTVLAVLKDVCQEFYNDPEWTSRLIDEPEPQGILSFGSSALDFRILARTVPGEQWAVDREMKNRIKRAFDQKGIEIPYNFVNVIDRTEKKKD